MQQTLHAAFLMRTIVILASTQKRDEKQIWLPSLALYDSLHRIETIVSGEQAARHREMRW